MVILVGNFKNASLQKQPFKSFLTLRRRKQCRQHIQYEQFFFLIHLENPTYKCGPDVFRMGLKFL